MTSIKLRLLSAVAALLGCAFGAPAATFNVSNGDVTGLINAINTANANGEDDTINLEPLGTYTLTAVNNTDTGFPNGLPILRTDGGHTLTFTGNRSTIARGSSAPGFRIFQLASGANVTMTGLIISGGQLSGTPTLTPEGGGIKINNATLTMANCTVRQNFVSNSQTGAAVAAGGGIHNSGGTLTLQNCTLSGNGASANSNNGSSAIADGGAIENVDGTVRLRNCTVSGNSTSASSGGSIGGFPDASGAAIANFGSAAGNGTLIMSSCTFAFNIAFHGAFGGGGAGIENSGPTANVALGNCIFSQTSFSNFQGTITSAGYNLSDTGNGFLLGPADQTNANPMLGGLANHGGQTETHQPLPGSPAIDKGKRDAIAALAVTDDQRGVARPFDYPNVGPATGGDSSDIGSVEMNEFAQTGNVFIVNTADDHADTLCGTLDCTLREAITAANAQPGTDTIRFAAAIVNLTIDLNAPALPTLTSMNIEGPGANNLVVQRVATQEFRIFNIDHATVAISGLTIANGRLTPTGSVGAGINNFGGNLTLTGCDLRDNAGYAGGGLYNNDGGVATVINCTFRNNTAFEGAAIDNAAIGNTAMMTVTNCTFTGNNATNNGGAVTSGTFGATASLTLTNCTFHNNSAPNGGALSNSAATFGAAPATATAVLRNNIFFSGFGGANFSNAGGTNATATITSQGRNISSDAAGGPAGTAPGGFLNATGDLRNTDPKLAGSIGNFGGGINTIPLDPASPAINNATSAAPARDQRNFTRNGPPDIGAFEFGGQNPASLANISTRLRVLTGDNVLIGGFIITGLQNKNLVVRAIGPSLPLSDRLANPTLDLFSSSGQMIASNDDWRSDQQAQIQATGLQPTNDLESAVLATLAPGSYTAIVRGVNNGTGNGLVEVYDLDRSVGSEFGNISSRGLVQTGDDVMIGGFIIIGPDMQRVVIRAIGPSLTAFGVPGALQDPTLEFVDANGASVNNDDWTSTQAAEISATGLAPSDTRESAIVATLLPGPYTAIVRGKNNTTGVGLVEVYGIQ